MKKIFSILALSGVAGAMALGVSSLSNKGDSFVNVKADPELETYIPVNKTDFFQEGWSDDWGFVRTNVNETYWNEKYSYQAMDTFFDGCGWGSGSDVKESWQGTINSRKWTQFATTPYVYFTYGCARDFDVDLTNHPVKLVLHCDNEAAENRVTKSYEILNNTFCGIAMVFRYYEIPALDLTDLGDSFKMWIEFIDLRSDGYGANVFGWLHVNQTWDEVQDAGSRYYNAVRYPNQSGETKIKQQFVNNAALAAITIDDLNESFDDQEDFERNFTYDNGYGNNDWPEGRHSNKAISFASVRGGGDNDTNMPFNKTGLGLFKGWYDGDAIGGYVASDKPTYRFVSREFKLKGTGLISIKMAGHGASLHVIDVTNSNTETKYDLTTFVGGDDSWNIASDGRNMVTMVRHFINLSNLVGHTLKVAIADDEEAGWAAVYFDELITRYDTYEDVAFKVDSVAQVNKTGTHYAHYADKFLTNVANDATAAKVAHTFVTDYFAACRNASNHFYRCDATLGDLITRYQQLSADAKAIVDASEDFDGSNKPGEGNPAWYDYEIFKGDENTGAYTVGRAMQDFIAKQNQGGSSLSTISFGTANSSLITIIIITSVLAIIAAGVFMISKKRKAE